ncbi:MAG TPA: phosphoribosylamine--glycine ligase [Candidatus Sulfotelmatobacter sp.]|nr:phosphoribosylamine--glycine ligase [Candidatus Sulfotelmatobacter sp.]
MTTATPRRILILGSGAREHAMAWRLAAEPGVERVTVAPGNPGMAEPPTDSLDLVPGVEAADVGAVVRLARELRPDLIVSGPEAPLVAGVADALTAAGFTALGPGAAGARLEASKAATRDIATAAGVVMAAGAAFEAVAPALAFAAGRDWQVVVKADGLAAGKGVTACHDEATVSEALREALVEHRFGAAGARVVVEERLAGPEASVMALCDETAVLALPAARDHKRLEDGDEGPTTGGMGAYSPLPDLDEAAVEDLLDTVHAPVLAEASRRGIPFRGVLYAGLMLTDRGPRLLEFNVRLGDPEAQAVLPRLAVPLGPLLAAAAGGHLAAAAARLGLAPRAVLPAAPQACAAVVLAAAGYPARPRGGDPIGGLADARAAGGLVFTAGVAGAAGGLRTAGGRVLTVVGRGHDPAAAADAAYAAAGHVAFAGAHLRRDIGRVSAGVGG